MPGGAGAALSSPPFSSARPALLRSCFSVSQDKQVPKAQVGNQASHATVGMVLGSDLAVLEAQIITEGVHEGRKTIDYNPYTN